MWRYLAVESIVSEDVIRSRNDVSYSASSVAMTTDHRVVNAEYIAGSATWRLNDSTNVSAVHQM